MDQRTTAIDQDLKDIVDTRVDIAEKLDLLEQRMRDTAEGATMKFSRMLDEGTQGVTQLMDKTKAALDPVHKVDEYPWLMLGGAICAGYAIGLLESHSRAQRSGIYAYYPPGAHASRVMPEPNQKGKTSDRAEGVYEYYPDPSRARTRRESRNRTSIWDTISRELGTDTEEAKSALMQAGRSMMMEFASKLLPEIARSLGVTVPSPGKNEGTFDRAASSYSESRSNRASRTSCESSAQMRT